MTDHPSPHATGDGPGHTPEEVLATLDAELSRGARLRYVGVLLASLLVTGLVGLLWATEPSLPLRTHVAFGGIVVLGLGWAAITGYVLTRRRPLYATDRVLATGMAVIATVTAGSGAILVSVLRAEIAVRLGAAAVAIMIVIVAAILHLQARAVRASLRARRQALQQQTRDHQG